MNLEKLIASYWPNKNKEVVFSGSIPQFDELELYNIVNNFLLWNDLPEVVDHFPGFKSPNIL